MALTEDQTTVKSISGDRIISDEVQAITTDITWFDRPVIRPQTETTIVSDDVHAGMVVCLLM